MKNGVSRRMRSWWPEKAAVKPRAQSREPSPEVKETPDGGGDFEAVICGSFSVWARPGERQLEALETGAEDGTAASGNKGETRRELLNR